MLPEPKGYRSMVFRVQRIKQWVSEIQKKGIEEKIVLQKTKDKKIQLPEFPPDTKWGDITIQFLNGHEVIIKVKNKMYQTTYEAMGFQDERKKLPNKQWQFLQLLSIKKGEIHWENNWDLPLDGTYSNLLHTNLKSF